MSGAGPVHRHLVLNDNEKLAEFNNIPVPWHLQKGDEHTGGRLLPSAWLITEGRLVPYESTSALLDDTRRLTSVVLVPS